MTSLWIKISKEFAQQQRQVIFTSKLKKKSRRLGIWISRYYFLFSDFIGYSKSKDPKKIKKIIYLNGLKVGINPKRELERVAKGTTVMILVQNRIMIKLYSKEEFLLEHWRFHLRKLCVMLNFDESYYVTKLLGKGSYGRVF